MSEEQLKTKIEAEDKNCMIDENGNIIPINVWRYRLFYNDETASIEGESDDDGNILNAYKGNVTDGKLEHQIPVFIKVNNKLYKVTQLGDDALYRITFTECKNTR